MTHTFKTRTSKASRLGLALITTLIMSATAFAADTDTDRWTLKAQPTSSHTLITPSTPPFLMRIAPVSDDIIRIGDPEVMPAAPLADVGSVFDAYRSKTELSATDIAAIEAEIEMRFGTHASLPKVETGISFEPDISMLLKPFTPAKYQDPLSTTQR